MRLLHTMFRVANLDASKKFYTEVLGMKFIREKEYPQGRFTNCFLGYGEEEENTVLELTYNWDKTSTDYELGTAFGHIAIEVCDVYKACETIKNLGGKVVREAGPMKNSTNGTILAFVEDPDGYKIELLSPKRKD